MFGKLLSRKSKEEKKAEKREEAKQQIADAEKMMGGQMPDITDEMIDQMVEGDMPGMPQMGRMQKMALKSMKRMPMEKRREMMAQAMGKMADKAGGEDKEEMLQQIEEMRAAGQLNSKQYKIAKKRLGIK